MWPRFERCTTRLILKSLYLIYYLGLLFGHGIFLACILICSSTVCTPFSGLQCLPVVSGLQCVLYFFLYLSSYCFLQLFITYSTCFFPNQYLYYSVCHQFRICVFIQFKACVCYICQFLFFSSNDNLSKSMTNAFYLIRKALFVLEIFKFLCFHLPLFFSLLVIALEDD